MNTGKQGGHQKFQHWMLAYCGENFLSQLPPKFFPQPTNTRRLFLTEARLPNPTVESCFMRYQALKLDESVAIYVSIWQAFSA
jgi:hypothetical protein